MSSFDRYCRKRPAPESDDRSNDLPRRGRPVREPGDPRGTDLPRRGQRIGESSVPPRRPSPDANADLPPRQPGTDAARPAAPALNPAPNSVCGG